MDELSAEQYEALIKQGSDAVSIVSEDGTIQYQSPNSFQIKGWEPEELVGENILEYIIRTTAPASRTNFGRSSALRDISKSRSNSVSKQKIVAGSGWKPRARHLSQKFLLTDISPRVGIFQRGNNANNRLPNNATTWNSSIRFYATIFGMTYRW